MIKKNMVPLAFALLTSAAFAVGCSSSDSPSNGTGGSSSTGGKSGGGTGGTSGGGTGGTSGGGTNSGNSLTPTATGYVENADVGVVGAWYAYGDNVGDDGSPGTGKCQKVAMLPDSSCSTITAPDLTKTGTDGFPPSDLATGKMCTKGTAAKVVKSAADTTADYSNIFGTGIGFDFNNAGADKGGKKPWDATAHNVVGVSFDIDQIPDGFRVEFATVANGGDNPYWGGASSNTSKNVVVGNNKVMFTEVGGPMYIAAAKRVDPDWKQLLSIQFHVSTGTSKAIPFEYCISNLKLITQ